MVEVTMNVQHIRNSCCLLHNPPALMYKVLNRISLKDEGCLSQHVRAV